ncbi:hypothetical protein BC937DRAFT_90719 [Endogone sp. FLAS-F59071]|nr:hypothetical protein BC937DRAFT_90719 [Endogone sp. FLAS-F59071]|eukprot:RUS16861.1 hypothetical protein BC937DRAFT_90719 [Endogone sp. FLAS-F59071]
MPSPRLVLMSSRIKTPKSVIPRSYLPPSHFHSLIPHPQLKAVCVPLLTFPSISRVNTRPILQSLNALLATLRSIPDPSTIFTKSLIDYVLFPLLELYKRRRPHEPLLDTVSEAWLSCILFLLEECGWNKILEPEEFKQLFTLFVLSVGGPLVKPTDQKPPIPSEETMLVAIRCLGAMLPPAPDEGKVTDPFEEEWDIAMGDSTKPLGLLDTLQSEAFRPSVGHCVTVLLDVISMDRLLELRLATLRMLSQLLIDNLKDAEILASFLPGVSSAICKVIVREQHKENHRVISAAVDLLGGMVVRVMNDEVNTEFVRRVTSLSDLRNFVNTESSSASEAETETETLSPNDTTPTAPSRIFITPRTRQWFTSTQTHLTRLLNQTLIITRNHPEFSTRLHILDFSYSLLSRCALTLESLVPTLIETLVLHIDDPYVQVSTRSRSYLSSLSHHPDFAASLVPILKANLHRAMLSLAHHLTSADEMRKINALRLVTGFLGILGVEARSVIEATLEKAAGGWLSGLEMDEVDGRVVEETSGAGRFADLEDGRGVLRTAKGDRREDERAHVGVLPMYPAKRFGYLASEDAVDGVSRMFRTLGRVEDVAFLVEFFMGYLRPSSSLGGVMVETGSCQPQAAWVINELLLGAAGFAPLVNSRPPGTDSGSLFELRNTNSERQVHAVAKQVLRELVTLDVLAAPTSAPDKDAILALQSQLDPLASLALTSTTRSTSATPIPSLNLTILTICHILECVATTSLILGPAFKFELVDTLHQLLDQLGSHSTRIASTASITLDAVARACGYGLTLTRGAKTPTQALVLDNVDYVVDAVVRRMAAGTFDPRAPRVLAAVVRVGGGRVIELMDDAVEEVFEALDTYHLNGWICAELCGVLREVVRAIEADEMIREETRDGDLQEGRDTNEFGNGKEIAEFAKGYVDMDFGDDGYEHEARNETKAMQEIGEYFLEQQKKKKKAAELDIDELEELAAKAEREQDGPPSGSRDPDTDRKTPPTRNQQTVLDILSKTVHFLTAPSPHLRSQILSLTGSALPVLRARPRDLNPLVHRIWPSIVRRLDDHEHFVVLEAAHLVQSVAECCGDFLSRRVVDDVWPRFRTMLSNRIREAEAEWHGAVAVGTERSVVYSAFSRAHRLQRSLLQTTAIVAEHVPIKDVEAREIAEVCAAYLDGRRKRSSGGGVVGVLCGGGENVGVEG